MTLFDDLWGSVAAFGGRVTDETWPALLASGVPAERAVGALLAHPLTPAADAAVAASTDPLLAGALRIARGRAGADLAGELAGLRTAAALAGAARVANADECAAVLARALELPRHVAVLDALAGNVDLPGTLVAPVMAGFAAAKTSKVPSEFLDRALADPFAHPALTVWLAACVERLSRTTLTAVLTVLAESFTVPDDVAPDLHALIVRKSGLGPTAARSLLLNPVAGITEATPGHAALANNARINQAAPTLSPADAQLVGVLRASVAAGVPVDAADLAAFVDSRHPQLSAVALLDPRLAVLDFPGRAAATIPVVTGEALRRRAAASPADAAHLLAATGPADLPWADGQPTVPGRVGVDELCAAYAVEVAEGRAELVWGDWLTLRVIAAAPGDRFVDALPIRLLVRYFAWLPAGLRERTADRFAASLGSVAQVSMLRALSDAVADRTAGELLSAAASLA